jgi:chromate transporter
MTGRSGQPGHGTLAEVFRVFLKLGLTSFGGPIAHIGYFRHELVERQKWIDDAGYADLVALCQFLPGPASSQVGFAMGILRAGGLLGGLAAWLAFTLPSAVILVALAFGAGSGGGVLAEGILHGLKLVAVAVVAQAVLGMVQALTPDRNRAAIALAAVAITVALDTAWSQIAAIAFGALAGLVLCRNLDTEIRGKLRFPVSARAGLGALVTFAILLLALPLLAMNGNAAMQLVDAFFRSGALVFGGGHVVLPLLHAEVVTPGWVSESSFLAGYGLAQAVPGPLFTFAAYLGAVRTPSPNGLAGATIALVALFLPGLLLVTGLLPFWDRLRKLSPAQAAMKGASAAVVGILGAALYSPVWTSGVLSPRDFFLALTGFLLLTTWKTPPVFVVMLLAAAGGLLGWLQP